MIRQALASVDFTPKSDSQEDFLTFLTTQNAKSPAKMSEMDMMNHMFVNLYVTVPFQFSKLLKYQVLESFDS